MTPKRDGFLWILFAALSTNSICAFAPPWTGVRHHNHNRNGNHPNAVSKEAHHAPSFPSWVLYNAKEHRFNSPRFYGIPVPPIQTLSSLSSSSALYMTGKNNNKNRKAEQNEDVYFDPRTTLTLIGGQSVLILIALVLAILLQTPNFGLGSGFSFDAASLQAGGVLAIPLGALAGYLDTIEDRYPALQDVTRATQRSVLSLLGGTFKPLIGLLVAFVLGVAAGVGEEMLFRGLLQYELISRSGLGIIASLGLSSIIFGLLHAVTPLYAALACFASIYFGVLYIVFDNLAVPIACHSFYDVGALLYAHWTVSRLTDKERAALALWSGPAGTGKSGRRE